MAAAIAVIAALPMETWKHNKLYDGVVFMFKNDAIVEQVRPYEQQGFLLASDGYTPAAIISSIVFRSGGLPTIMPNRTG